MFKSLFIFQKEYVVSHEVRRSNGYFATFSWNNFERWTTMGLSRTNAMNAKRGIPGDFPLSEKFVYGGCGDALHCSWTNLTNPTFAGTNNEMKNPSVCFDSNFMRKYCLQRLFSSHLTLYNASGRDTHQIWSCICEKSFWAELNFKYGFSFKYKY